MERNVITFTVTFVLFALPWEYHIDCSGWTGAAVVRFSMRITARDGTVVKAGIEMQPNTTPEDVRAIIWSQLEMVRWRSSEVGKGILVLEGAPKSPIWSVEFTSKDWKPDVRMVLKLSEKK